MKTFKITFALSLCLLLAGIFAGCADKSHVRRRGDGTITLVLQAPAMESGNAMRQMSADQESAVSADKLYVLVFKTKDANSVDLDEPNEQYAYTAKVASVTRLTDKNQYEAKIRLKADDATTPYRLVLITNCDFDPTALSEGMTKTEVFASASLKKAFTDKWPTDANARIPMWGESNTQRITENVTFGDCKDTNSTNRIHLVRSLARVDVGLNFGTEFTSETATPNGQTPFKLQSVRVYRMANSFTIPGTQSNTFHMDNNAKKPIPVLPDGVQMAADANPLVFDQVSDPEKATVREIYIPERLKGTNRTDRPCLVIGGLYNGKLTYYRLDFIKTPKEGHPKDTAEALDILRNHRYRFNITKVTGPGSDTPEDALLTEPVNIAFDVVVWNDGEIGEIRYDGQYYLAVNKDKFEFGKDEGDDAFTVRTNWEQGYKFVDANGNELPKTKEEAVAKGMWYYLSDPKDPAFVKDQDFREKVFVLENTTGAARPSADGAIYVQAGRIKWPLKIKQSDKVELDIKIYLSETGNWRTDCEKNPITGHTCMVDSVYKFWVKYTPNSKLGRIPLDRDEQFTWTRLNDDPVNGIAQYQAVIHKDDFPDDAFGTSEITKFRVVKGDAKVESDFTLRVMRWDAIPYKDSAFTYNMLSNDVVYTLGPGNKHFFIRANAGYELVVESISIQKLSGEPQPSEVVKEWREGKLVDDKVQPAYAEGEEVLFQTYDYLKGTDKELLHGQIVSAHVTMLLKPKAAKGQEGYFKPKKFIVHFVSAIIQPEANTYVVEAGQIPILIPCSQLNRAHDWMAQYKNEIETMIESRVGLSGGQAMSQSEYNYYVQENGPWGELAYLPPTDTNWDAKVVWSTLHPSGVEHGLEDVHAVNIDMAGRNYIYVKPKPQYEGCALVSAFKNGTIIWNWTIWVVKKKKDYGQGYPWDDSDNKTHGKPYMNRNLGAYRMPYNVGQRTTTYFDEFFNDMTGLYYRHGTPIPHHAYDPKSVYLLGDTYNPQALSSQYGPHCSRPWYNPVLFRTEKDRRQDVLDNKKYVSAAAGLQSLNDLIKNPTKLHYKDAVACGIIEFGSNEISATLGKVSWQGGNGPTILNNRRNFIAFTFKTEKTPFDPSPYGWKVPAAGAEAMNMINNSYLVWSMTGAYLNGNIRFNAGASANGVIVHVATCYGNSDRRVICYYDNNRNDWFLTDTDGSYAGGDYKTYASSNYNVRCIENEAESDYLDYTQDAVLKNVKNATRAVFRSRR